MGYERYARGRSQDDWDRDTRDPRYGRDSDDAAARDYGSGDLRASARDDQDERGYYSRDRDVGRSGSQYGSHYGDDYRGGVGNFGSSDYRSTSDRFQSRDRFQGRDQAREGRQPQGYDAKDRGFFERAGDEVRSWFGDDEAERRRQFDAQHAHDRDYHDWRSGQIAALDRDYDEYRRENQQRFSNEFATWRTDRQGQRSSLDRVAEHMDVIGSDGEHIGTVDKVRGDRLILTKSDPDAGGRHHSIPSRWIDSVTDKVTVRKTADQAKAHWRDEERGAFFGDDNANRDEDSRGRILNRSFSGTY